MSLPSVPHDHLNRLADQGRWIELLRLARDAEAATIDARREAAYVIALEAPAEIAAAAVDLFPDDAGRPGPLWEVVAHRPWRDLRGHLPHQRTRHLVAHTRVLRGEDLRWDDELDVGALGAPLCLLPWEAARWDGELDVPGYDRGGAAGTTGWRFPPFLADPVAVPPPVAPLIPQDVPPELAALSPDVKAYAFHATAWQAAAAVGSPGPDRRAARFAFADAYPSLVHLAAGHRAYGSFIGREFFPGLWSGQALGRRAVWRALTALAGVADPTDVERVNAFVQRLRCVGWVEPHGEPLHYLHLAMEDPERSIAWVLEAQDRD